MEIFNNTLLTRFIAKKPANIRNQEIVGISATANNITMAHICGSVPGEIQVCSYRCVPTRDRQEQISAVKEYVEEYQLMGCPCSYVLPSNKYTLGIIESPDVPENKRVEAVRWAAKDFVEYPIEEAVIDSFPLPVKKTGDNKDLSYAIIVRATVIDEVIAFVKEIGLKLKYIDIQELCLRNIAMLHPESNNGTLLLRLYEGGGNVVFIKGHTIFMTRRIELPLAEPPIESNAVIIGQSAVTEEKTDSLITTLALNLQRSMDYCNSMFRQSTVNCIMLSPAEFALNSISDSLAKELGMPAYILNLTDIMHFSQEISQLEQAKCLLAIGAGLRQVVVADV